MGCICLCSKHNVESEVFSQLSNPSHVIIMGFIYSKHLPSVLEILYHGAASCSWQTTPQNIFHLMASVLLLVSKWCFAFMSL